MHLVWGGGRHSAMQRLHPSPGGCFPGQAAACPAGSMERMVQVVAFTVSTYSSCQRTKRSLNPLLSETFEYICPERGLRSIAEHVRAAGRRCASAPLRHARPGAVL